MTVQERAHQAGLMIPTRKGEPERGAFKVIVMDSIQSREERDLPMSEIIERATRVVRTTWPDFQPEYAGGLLDV